MGSRIATPTERLLKRIANTENVSRSILAHGPSHTPPR